MLKTLPPAIIFDWDNTLVDTFVVLRDAHNLVRAAMGMPPWSDDEARHNIRLAAKDAFPKWYGARAGEAQAIYAGYVRENHLRCMTVFDGTRDLLDYLAANSVRLAVLSNKRGEFLRAEIAHLGWEGRFSVILGADDIDGPAKPDPGGLTLTMDRMGLQGDARGASWYAGDTENDLLTARAAGSTPVFIENHTMCDEAVITALCPARRFKNPRECLAYLKTLG